MGTPEKGQIYSCIIFKDNKCCLSAMSASTRRNRRQDLVLINPNHTSHRFNFLLLLHSIAYIIIVDKDDPFRYDNELPTRPNSDSDSYMVDCIHAWQDSIGGVPTFSFQLRICPWCICSFRQIEWAHQSEIVNSRCMVRRSSLGATASIPG